MRYIRSFITMLWIELLVGCSPFASTSRPTIAPEIQQAHLTLIVQNETGDMIPTAFIRFKWADDPWDVTKAAGRHVTNIGHLDLLLPMPGPDARTDTLIVYVEAPNYLSQTQTIDIMEGSNALYPLRLVREPLQK